MSRQPVDTASVRRSTGTDSDRYSKLREIGILNEVGKRVNNELHN